MNHPKRPLIGVTTAELAGHEQTEPALWAMRSSYCQVLLDHQATPILLPQITYLENLGPLLTELDGLLIPDGTDLDPVLYGSPPEENLEATDPVRDRSESLVVAWALTKKIPMIGISRGMHMINVVAGGTLFQDIPTDLDLPTEHRKQPVTYGNLSHHGHLIKITSESRLSVQVGHPEIWVNSMHHQAIKKLGHNLVVVARSADQVIEAIENPDPSHWLIGLQFHPEAMIDHDPWVTKLFGEFVQAARDFRAPSHLADTTVSSLSHH